MSNNYLVPQSKDAMNKFKMEAASEVGVNLKNGYNGDLTASQAGHVGGQMVKSIVPKRKHKITRWNRNMDGHTYTINATVNVLLNFEHSNILQRTKECPSA